MNTLIFLSLFFISTLAQAQLDTMQDRPDIVWSEIESRDFKVVYPAHMKPKAQYILNLLQYYKESASETYDEDTRKYTLILRSELASPNGFVTLMPRRTEWFSASAISPVVSSLEWYQSLAIHEYRHMVQFDFIKRPHVQWGYWLFGDLGGAALMAITAPPWYFEGDAVWAETVLSNAGRGRAPRFSARMKSLMVNNEIPTYDEFYGGVYDTYLPNHYVYGYFLITSANKKYGDKTWKKVIDRAALRPYNLYTFYNAFKEVTGDDFMDFYHESMQELQTQWKAEEIAETQNSNELYTRYDYPMVDEEKLYFLKWDLDSFWALYRSETLSDGTKATKIKELNISPTLSKVDLKRGKFVYSQLMPHKRYSYRGFSDLYLLDVNSGEQKRITEGQRLYHPQLHPEKDLVMAVEFVDSIAYGLAFFDFNGRKLQVFKPEGHEVAEAVWLDGENVLAILLDPKGMRHIARINTQTKTVEMLKPAGRNNIYSLQTSQKKAYFEADDQGVVSVFELNLSTNVLSRCVREEIAAYRPFPNGDEIIYVEEVRNGQRIKSASKSCDPVAGNYIGDIDQYIGDTPSDNFHESAPKNVYNFEKLFASKWSEKNFFELEEGFTPSVWSFVGDRGFQLMGSSRNYLNTFTATATVGEDANESRPFAQLLLSYRKYYPILSLSLAYQERNTDDGEWTEARSGLGATLPYIYRKNLYRGSHSLSVFGERVEMSDRDASAPYEIDDEQMFLTRTSFSTSLLKETRFRELQPNWGYSFQAQYVDAQASEDKGFSSYLAYGDLDLYFPGMSANHGTRLALSGEYRTESDFSYRIASPANAVSEYAFSRGYEYEYVDSWHKAALNYILPLSYPNKAYGRWIYFNRVYANLFFDHTKIVDMDDFSLNSAGAELFFESTTFRKIPLTYGLRLISKLSDYAEDEEEEGEDSVAELFFQVNIPI